MSITNRCSCPLRGRMERRMQLGNAVQRWVDAAGQLNSMLDPLKKLSCSKMDCVAKAVDRLSASRRFRRARRNHKLFLTSDETVLSFSFASSIIGFGSYMPRELPICTRFEGDFVQAFRKSAFKRNLSDIANSDKAAGRRSG